MNTRAPAVALLSLLLVGCSAKSRALPPREGEVEVVPAASQEGRDSPVGAADPSAGSAAPPCLRATSTAANGKLESAELDEVSGIVASRAQPGVYWVHNDSGDSARAFAIDLDGQVLAELVLSGARARDFEDIALLPSTGADGSSVDVLYIADTGDNWHARSSVQIYRVQAPQVPRGKRARIVRQASTIVVTYDDGGHDVESMFADVRSGDLYLVAKGSLFSRSQPVSVYRLAAKELASGRVRAKRVAMVPMGPTTAADMLPDGSGIAIRNYSRAWFWPRTEGESIASALRRRGCELPLADGDEQGESFAFTSDGAAYVTIAEGEHSPIHVTAVARRP